MNTYTLVLVIVLTTLASLGTLVGALAAYQVLRYKAFSKNLLKFIVALGGGILVATIVLVLVPEGMRTLKFSWFSIMFLAGSATFMLADILIESMGERASQILANVLDSVPQSVGVGAAFAVGGTTGPLLILLVGLQNVAEGFNAYGELRSSGMSTRANLALQFFSSLLGPVAGVIGFLFLSGHEKLISGLFMFSAGGILYLIFHDIAPLAYRERHWVPTLGTSLGFVLGLASQALVG